jgi:thiol-disulfide isomerase/thioredoxin
MEEIIGLDILDEFILNNQDKHIILFFGAIWCGPCKKLKNNIMEIKEIIDNKNCILCYIDVDNELNSDITSKYKINFLPTQIFINLIQKNNCIKININNRIDGYDYTKLEQIINEL